MSKFPIIFYSTLIAITVFALIYSIITGNALGIALLSCWCGLLVLYLMLSIIDLHQKKKSFNQETQKWLEFFKKEQN